MATARRLIFNVAGSSYGHTVGLKDLASSDESVSSAVVAAVGSHPVCLDSGEFLALGLGDYPYEINKASDLSYVGNAGPLPDSVGKTCLARFRSSFYALVKHKTGGTTTTATYEWKLRQFAADGSLLATWDLTSQIPEATDTTMDSGSYKRVWNYPASMAVVVDGSITIVYLAITVGLSQARATTIRKIVPGISNDAFITAAAGDVSSTLGNGLLAMRDGSLLAAWTGSSGTSSVKRYDAAGTLLGTYPMPNPFNNVIPMQLGFDGSTFWAGCYDPGMSNGFDYIEWNVAGQSIVRTITTDLDGWTGSAIAPDSGFLVDYTVTAPTGIPLSTPSAPQIQCAPQTQVGNGGRGPDPKW